MEQVKFIYYPLGNALEKQTKTIEDQDKKTYGKQLIKYNAFPENDKSMLLDKQEKYLIILSRRELENMKNYIIVLIFKIWFVILRVPLKI